MLEGGKYRLVLDHIVAKPKPKKKLQNKDAEAATVLAEEAAQPPGKTIAPMKKTFGPLSVSSIGLSVSGKSFSKIIISLDATLTLGPVSLKLIGLTLTFNLESVTSLDNFRELTLEIGIRGMAVDFEKPPSKLAGLFIPFGSPDDAEAGFMGVMAVSVSTWSAIAASMYMENNSDHLMSLFVFGAGPSSQWAALTPPGSQCNGYLCHLSD